jgi:hypothetical protein
VYDPEVKIDTRLLNELGIKARNAEKFYGKQDKDEQEVKFLLKTNTASQRIVDKINSTPNRFVDLRDYTRNQYILLTMNMDTQDRILAKNGLSLRVRAAIDPVTSQINGNIDMCLKTVLPSESNIIQIHSSKGANSNRRGEWECALKTVDPKIEELIAENLGSEPALPDMILAGAIRNEDLFVESLGCSMRGIYPSYEIIRRHGYEFAATFQHAQDMANIFMTPDANQILHEDIEEEFEFLKFRGISEGDITQAQFDKIMGKSMDTLGAIILSADTCNIIQNRTTKSMRARTALESIYGPPAPNDENASLRCMFNADLVSRINFASAHALSLKIRTTDVDFELVNNQIAHIKAATDRLPSLTGEMLPERQHMALTL